ncbi:MAG: hypothetical protein A3G25_11590 [Betaproteobacteria bacterium RIFCSPLOWO2_12_FULL_63_13]|nr:MAG: hypothetical protein A3H32_00150 [Betaproteobacteria bacterium RIFCSPLOWO2_02_FULL_63_19]OGA53463.1 MAG: hypothetical protein A3G25_11590 [Betaproteobacteria bacterium RIFCSPLOWO2_12_FULL_63_13]
MLLLRILGIITAAAVGWGIVVFLVTGNREFLRFALRLLKWAIILALVFFALIILERLTRLT